jgi:hypothetical protein
MDGKGANQVICLIDDAVLEYVRYTDPLAVYNANMRGRDCHWSAPINADHHG